MIPKKKISKKYKIKNNITPKSQHNLIKCIAIKYLSKHKNKWRKKRKIKISESNIINTKK